MQNLAIAVVVFLSTLAVGCGDGTATDGGTDATLNGMCPSSAPTSGGACSPDGMQCGPYAYGHVDCVHPGQPTTGYPISATFTCTGGTWTVQTMSQGSCSDD